MRLERAVIFGREQIAGVDHPSDRQLDHPDVVPTSIVETDADQLHSRKRDDDDGACRDGRFGHRQPSESRGTHGGTHATAQIAVFAGTVSLNPSEVCSPPAS